VRESRGAVGRDRLLTRDGACLIYRIAGHYPTFGRKVVSLAIGRRLDAEPSLDHRTMDGDVGPGRSDDDVAVNSDISHPLG
jgi:hypothetical protein